MKPDDNSSVILPSVINLILHYAAIGTGKHFVFLVSGTLQFDLVT